jgi:hypothetical protein
MALAEVLCKGFSQKRPEILDLRLPCRGSIFAHPASRTTLQVSAVNNRYDVDTVWKYDTEADED